MSDELIAILIGNRIRKSRRRRSLSQVELAHGICSQPSISSFENGSQLILGDVFTLIAQRLDDPELTGLAILYNAPGGKDNLAEYVKYIIDNNPLDIVDLLLSYSGHFSRNVITVALKVLHQLYNAREFHLVIRLTQKVIGDIHPQDHARSGYAEACFYCGSSLLYLFELNEAIEWLKKAELESHTLDSRECGRLNYNLAYAYTCIHSYALALKHIHVALGEFERLRDYSKHVKCVSLLGLVELRMGRAHEGIKVLEQAREIMMKFPDMQRDVARVEANLAEAYLSIDLCDVARLRVEAALQCGVDDQVMIGSCYRILSLISHNEVDNRSALEFFEKSWKLAKDSRDLWSLARTCLLGLKIHLSAKKKVIISKYTLRLISQSNLIIERAAIHEYLSLCYRAEGQVDKSVEQLNMAVDLYRCHFKIGTDIEPYFVNS